MTTDFPGIFKLDWTATTLLDKYGLFTHHEVYLIISLKISKQKNKGAVAPTLFTAR